jgi:hypothetical protein
VTLPARSSSASLILAAGLCALLAAGCSHSGSALSGKGADGTPYSAVGFVRLEPLVKKHPLYGQLATLDEDIAALELRAAGSAVAAGSSAEIAAQEGEIRKQFDAATARAKGSLDALQTKYRARESAAIREALAGSAGGPGGAAIAGGVAGTAAAQQNAALAQARNDLETFRKQLLAQEETQFNALQTSLNERAAHTYRAKSEELSQKESGYALELASRDSAERLSLRAKLSNLSLEEADRAELKAQLEALDRKEADELATVRNRDGQTLEALQKQLQDQTRAELTKSAQEMRKNSVAKLNERELKVRATLQGPAAGAAAGPPPAAQLSPEMKAKLEALHKDYQAQFDRDAQSTLKELDSTRNELSLRFARLHGVDAAAQASARKEIAGLQKQRSELYSQMVAQIGREVKAIAERRGVSVVFGDSIAPGGGVDLTPDAEKDIESLHQ